MRSHGWLCAALCALAFPSVASAQKTETADQSSVPAAKPAAPTDLTAAGSPEKPADAGKASETARAGDAAQAGDAKKPIDTAPKPGEAGASKPAADAASIKVERTATGAKLFRITEGLVVEGQMQKPAAFYVLRRAAIHYDYSELGKSFLPKIGAAVKAPPF